MKKILIALAVALASFQIADAQVKPEAAKKAVDSALEASNNPKKATKAATWINLGKAYVAAYDAPMGSIWVGANKTELALLLGNEKPISSEECVLGGQALLKEIYSDKNLYFDVNTRLVAIEVTKPVVEEALIKASVAYTSAYSLDPKKADEIKEAFKLISEKLVQEAYNRYTLDDLAQSSVIFEQAADVVALAPLSQLDTNSLYNAGFTAFMAKDNERAKQFFGKCLENGYYSENGELFAKLAEVDKDNAKQYLEEGFSKFPQSQSILIGLINYYITNNEDPEKLFTLLDQAKANEPNNPSLYYVEGNIRTQLQQYDEAVVAYEKCSEIDPNYVFGFVGEGIMYYNLAIDFQTKAQEELDDNKYMTLVAEFTTSLKNCIAPFEKAFGMTKDDSIKVSIAEYLKNAYYRFIDEDPANKTAYDKYAAIVSNGTAE